MVNKKNLAIYLTSATIALSLTSFGLIDNVQRLGPKIIEGHSRTYMPDIKKQLIWQDHVLKLHKDMHGYQNAIPFYVMIKEKVFKGYDLPDSLKRD